MGVWEIGVNVAATRGHVCLFWGGRDEATAGTENCLETMRVHMECSSHQGGEQTDLFRHPRLRLCQGGGGETS